MNRLNEIVSEPLHGTACCNSIFHSLRARKASFTAILISTKAFEFELIEQDKENRARKHHLVFNLTFITDLSYFAPPIRYNKETNL
ncbi:hypothetical protein RRG08_061963 [Elysia crispata]|uniref:Uncharacterized protein n=1 Tax=Elysia crispata TaxID=231223 RepID=A0AAE0ZJN8_9GAST|nr:hypothetical protein RRG08_061963 [Elysia crispata]